MTMVDPYTKLKYLAIDDGGKYSTEERTFSLTCKSRVLCPYREYRARESVHIKLFVSSVSFSHNNIRLQTDRQTEL